MENYIQMKVSFKELLIGSFVLIISAQMFFSCSSAQESYDNVVKSYRQEKYSGVIINKFIDKDEHMNKKVIVKHKYGEKVILFNFEAGGLYDYLIVGDSVIKNDGEIKLRVIRNDIDTTIEMKFIKPN